jgi:hypothetical protein
MSTKRVTKRVIKQDTEHDVEGHLQMRSADGFGGSGPEGFDTPTPDGAALRTAHGGTDDSEPQPDGATEG